MAPPTLAFSSISNSWGVQYIGTSVSQLGIWAYTPCYGGIVVFNARKVGWDQRLRVLNWKARRRNGEGLFIICNFTVIIIFSMTFPIYSIKLLLSIGYFRTQQSWKNIVTYSHTKFIQFLIPDTEKVLIKCYFNWVVKPKFLIFLNIVKQ